MTNAELIADAREAMGVRDDTGWFWVGRLIDALEAAEARVKELEAQAKDHNAEQIFRISELQELGEAQARIAELEAGDWQYSYFEKWADGSGVYERVTFRTLAEARKWFDNSGDMSGWNAEVKKKDRLVAGIEKRRVVEPGPWVPVESEGE